MERYDSLSGANRSYALFGMSKFASDLLDLYMRRVPTVLSCVVRDAIDSAEHSAREYAHPEHDVWQSYEAKKVLLIDQRRINLIRSRSSDSVKIPQVLSDIIVDYLVCHHILAANNGIAYE